MEVVATDEAAIAQVHQLALDGGLAAAANDRERAPQRRPVAAGVHRPRFVDRDEQQFVFVRDHQVALQQVAQLARLERAGADLGHGCRAEALGQERQQVPMRRQRLVFGRPAGDISQAPSAGHQADSDFHQSDVAFHRRHPARRIDRGLAAAAQRHAADRRDHRHRGITQPQHGLLHELLGIVDRADAHRHEGGQHRLQVGPDAEGLVARPDHQPVEFLLGQLDRLLQPFADLRTDRMHLGLEACDQDRCGCLDVVQRPQADSRIFVQCPAGAFEASRLAAQHRFRKQLPCVHRQDAAWLELARSRVPGTLGRVHPTGRHHGVTEDPIGQRCIRQRLAGRDVFLDPAGHLQPAGFLPELERALLHAEAPAHREVDVARRVGDRREVHGGVMEAVAQDRPEKLPLRALRISQQPQALSGRLPEHPAVDFVALVAARHVLAAFRLEPQHVAADLLVEAGLGLLAQAALLQQRLQDRGRAEAGVERIARRVQRLLQCLDHMRQRVQSDHVGGTKGA